MCRISFISGHVNTCGAGRFVASYNVTPGYDSDANSYGDFRVMMQFITAAMVDLPPDRLTMKGLYMSGKKATFDQNTVEKLYKLFERDVDGNLPPDGNRKLLARRSFLTIEEELSVANGAYGYDGMVATLIVNIHAETADSGRNVDRIKTVPYRIDVPPLCLNKQGANASTSVGSGRPNSSSPFSYTTTPKTSTSSMSNVLNPVNPPPPVGINLHPAQRNSTPTSTSTAGTRLSASSSHANVAGASDRASLVIDPEKSPSPPPYSR
ncbi:hypothetical protein AX774_g4433 [Zancudomyces culisetae]|uniref:PhoD-like phosphatase domain-containing protein n=1 Tax=Zancudomyces culisetae TaxID=1213189 RepID=A0A1R1PMA5_ZANCU|nr:hypothetical protein AX774_g4433 [Zancudomyces culisetae]|eukprot:OMH82101.1 hypothetical protein AX774_g4433 [Zancudomyces culisetae]